MIRAKARKVGSLAFLETELGQKAVVPWDKLCDVARRLGIEVEVNDLPLKCEEFDREESGKTRKNIKA